nr:glycoside hydrolase family 3 N-terminal domain-containing protein [Kocuria atrinae]
MVIGSHYPGYSAFLPNPVEGQILNQEDVWRDANPITGVPFAEPVLVTSATNKAINERGQRYFVVRDNLTPQELTEWTNAVQELAENSRLGIPAVFASNPRNHVALVSQFGVNESTGIFSEWPGELGLAALNDPELIEKFGQEIAKEWRAGGIHKLYGTWLTSPPSLAGPASMAPSVRIPSWSPSTSAPWCAACRARP